MYPGLYRSPHSAERASHPSGREVYQAVLSVVKVFRFGKRDSGVPFEGYGPPLRSVSIPLDVLGSRVSEVRTLG